jgi:hypothetical protein
MTAVSNQVLPGSGLGISLIFNAAGDVIFARRGTSGVTAYDYDPATGTIGAQLWTQAITGRPTYFGMDQMALHPNQLDLFVTIAGQVRLDAPPARKRALSTSATGWVRHSEPGASLSRRVTYTTTGPAFRPARSSWPR